MITHTSTLALDAAPTADVAGLLGAIAGGEDLLALQSKLRAATFVHFAKLCSARAGLFDALALSSEGLTQEVVSFTEEATDMWDWDTHVREARYQAGGAAYVVRHSDTYNGHMGTSEIYLSVRLRWEGYRFDASADLGEGGPLELRSVGLDDDQHRGAHDALAAALA